MFGQPRKSGSTQARADDDGGAVGGDHRHVAVPRPLRLGIRGLEVEAASHRLEHDPLLGHRQRRAEAAAGAAAERDPLVGARLAAGPALGSELERLRIEILAVVEEEDADQDRGVGLHRVGAQSPRFHHPAADDRDHGPRSHRLEDRRLDLLLGALPGADRLAQAVMRLGRADEALPGPGERVRGRLVAGEDEGQELVADLAVAQFLAVLGPGQEELGEDVAALAEVVGAAAAGDHRVGRAVEEVERDLGESDRLVAEEVHQLADLGDRLGRGGDQALGREPQPELGGVAARDALDPEDPGHDHVERYRLHPRRERERPADRPAIDLALGGGRDRTRVALDRLAVEVGEEQLALPHVPGSERGQDRVRADDRRQFSSFINRYKG